MAGALKNDKKLSIAVRRLALSKIKAALEDTQHKKYTEKFQNELLLKLASTVLPRITEVSGDDGGPIHLLIDN